MAKREDCYTEIWLDLLCWESILKILFLYGSNKKVYYCQVSKLFLPFQRLLQSLTKIPLIQVQNFVFSEERVDNVSAYEMVNNKLRILLENIGVRWVQSRSVNDFARRYNFNIEKIKEHLKESAFFYLYRPMEIIVMAEAKSRKTRQCFVLRKTPFSEILNQELRSHSIVFYRPLFSPSLSIIKRKNYFLDNTAFNNSFGRIGALVTIFLRWSIAVIKSVIATTYRNYQREFWSNSQVNIGVEQLQSRMRWDEINDIFWFKGSFIAPETIFVFGTEGLDLESQKIFGVLGVTQVSTKIPFLLWFKGLFKKHKISCDTIYVAPGLLYLAKTLNLLTAISKCVVSWNEVNWLCLQLEDYKCRVFYWQSVCERLSIKILWSMIDRDNNKLAKSQALESLGGFYTGSHWSVYPFYHGLNRKYYDLFFIWGQYFTDNVFDDYACLEKFIVGYPSDHYFDKQLERAGLLRARYNGKFIISYHDNMAYDDVVYNMNMQIQLYGMLLSLLDKNNHVVLFFKPKRKYLFEKILEEIPRISDFIKTGRIVTFFGDTWRTKEVPAMVGMASDLVVGLGISTAATECYFAGTLAFHADFTKLTNNEFANQGLGKIVFRDAESLRIAIQNTIDEGVSDKYHKYKGLYNRLDPFQDGQAYKRVEFVLRNLQELLSQGYNREEAAKIAKDRYNDYVQATARLN
ncbi:MAG: hypothetical protein HOG49_34215 [Candidatus Scalindua sp.]|jgi:hypothetical protein|nr:hypothetical protein [Candidatus Scalindua sp.]